MLKIRLTIKDKIVRTIQEGIMKFQTGGTVTMEGKRRVKEGFSDVENMGELTIIRLNVPHF